MFCVLNEVLPTEDNVLQSLLFLGKKLTITRGSKVRKKDCCMISDSV